jgi:2-dehydropantoate 2-reductase
MSLHILGGGSIGLLYASSMKLAKTKLPVCLLLQSHYENKVNLYKNYQALDKVFSSSRQTPLRSGGEGARKFVLVDLEDINGNNHRQDIPCEIINNVNAARDIQNVLLTTKAPQAVEALESIYHRLKLPVNLIVMTNGSLGVVDEIKKSLNDNKLKDNVNIIFASSTHGAMRGNYMHLKEFRHDDISTLALKVTHTGQGQTFLEDTSNGNNSDSIQRALKNVWNEAGLEVSMVSPEEMHILNWKKLATNCAINPLTALRNCANGELLSIRRERPSYEDTLGNIAADYQDPMLFYELIREVSDIALAEVKKKKCTGDKARIDLSYTALVDFVENVVHQTSRNKSSMLQDVIAVRYPTEIQYLNGYISKRGKEYPYLDVQANDYVTKLVEKITKPKSR